MDSTTLELDNFQAKLMQRYYFLYHLYSTKPPLSFQKRAFFQKSWIIIPPTSAGSLFGVMKKMPWQTKVTVNKHILVTATQCNCTSIDQLHSTQLVFLHSWKANSPINNSLLPLFLWTTFLVQSMSTYCTVSPLMGISVPGKLSNNMPCTAALPSGTIMAINHLSRKCICSPLQTKSTISYSVNGHFQNRITKKAIY